MNTSRRLPMLVAATLVAGGTATLATGTAHAAALSAVLVRTVDTGAWATPSPDPAGITYDAAHNRLVLSDSEVDEMPLYQGTNVFFSTLDGQQTAGDIGWTTEPWSVEPTGISYQTAGHFLVADDDQDRVFVVDTGADGVWTPEDATPSSFSTRPLNGDAEDVTMDMDATTNGHVLVLDGVSTDMYDYGPGPNGSFDALPPAGDDTRVVFDVGQYGALDPEGIEYYPGRNTILVLDSGSRAVYELDRQGRLVNVISIATGGPKSAAGITLAPPSDGSPGLNLYISDRGVDNDSNPAENDGRFYEMAVTLPPLGDSTNRAPQVNAGPDLSVNQSVSAALSGSAGDDGLPDPPGTLSVAWSTVSGPGAVVFANPNAASTRATFGAVGTYVLRLTADDGDMSVRDDVSVEVTAAPPGGAVALDVPTGTGADDAEERSASTSVTGTDLELVVDGTTVQTVGIRFPGVAIPPGSTVTNAYVQFTVDEATSGATSLIVTGQAADDPPAFSSTGRDVSTRPRTTATVGWVPAGWPTAAARGMDQRTPDLAPVLQEIVGRSGWSSGNALALVITGSGTRTASATERGPAKAPVLHVEYVPAGGPNVAPTVSAGPDLAVTLPAAATLAGTVTDDGLPNPPGAVTAAWTRVSGPGAVTFADATSPATTATFGAPGTYVLRLTADDGVLLAADEVTVTVSAAPVNVAPAVSAGPDLAVTLPAAATLAGTVTDDGLPNPPGAVTAAWTTVSGPGAVTFADPAAAVTTATFGAAGSYVLRLTGSDGALQAVDEVSVAVSPAIPVNAAPTVSAGPDVAVTLPGPATLVGSVSDDGLPNPPGAVTLAWSKVSGPGKVTFANPAALTTTVTFASAGTFVLSLTANDGARTATDQVTVTVTPPTTVALDIPVATGSDDAEERPGSVSLTGTSLELVVDGTTVQTVGLRFTGVAVPAGATVTGAYLQFTSEAVTSGAVNLTVAGQAADNASTFQAVALNVSSRPRTLATVGWAPAAWTKRGVAEAAQRTPDLSAVVREIVGRQGWAGGNAVVLVLTGTGTRVAAAFERGGGKGAVLHIEYQR